MTEPKTTINLPFSPEDVLNKATQDMMVPNRIESMASRIEELERQIADLTRHNRELRETVKALLGPASAVPDYQSKPRGSFW